MDPQNPHRQRLGVITDGAFNATLTARLDAGVSTEGLSIGSFVIVEGEDHLYFSTISDLQLRVTDPNLLSAPPDVNSTFVRSALAGSATYAVVQVKPMLMLRKPSADPLAFIDTAARPEPVRTIPMHFATLRHADAGDFELVFGREGGQLFAMGTPLVGADLPISLDLERLMERSNGVFGQSGTGKSFLTRLLVCGIVHRKVGVNLIFDMHDEYAFGATSEEKVTVKGLKELFGTRIQVWSLSEQAARRPGRRVDATLKIGLNQIEADDILLLREELDLPETTETTIALLERDFHSDWLTRLLAMEGEALEDWAKRANASASALGALKRRLHLVERRPYIVKQADTRAIDEITALLDRGIHIILHFGNDSRSLDHVLVANIVTRRVRELYVQKVEKALETQRPSDAPKPLMITLEEAHKFLNPRAARQTIFGTIARELRKYRVTLMVVDQRPSGIDPEVLSQLGTRVTGKLTEERDIEAVLTGVASRSSVRAMLESLDTRQQILMVGHAVPMPIVLRTRRYDENFYRAVTGAETPGRDDRPLPSFSQDLDDLFGA